jgi:hypothetical protein
MTGLRGWMVALMVIFAALLGLGTLATVGGHTAAVAAEKCPAKQQYFREFGCVKKPEVTMAGETSLALHFRAVCQGNAGA